jgi:glyoxylase-like metal-dependent hydrolase (beta-lactamase superfamily II)
MQDRAEFVPNIESRLPDEIVPGVARLDIALVNAYLVGAPGGPWALVDAGPPLSAALTRRAASGRYGAGTRPEAIVLTHGHFDHAGAALELATGWDVPIYAHPLEMPYSPADPTIRRRTPPWAAPSRR